MGGLGTRRYGAFALEALGVSKRYRSREALGSVDLVALRGQIHELLGPNGAGQTTLIAVAHYLAGMRQRLGLAAALLRSSRLLTTSRDAMAALMIVVTFGCGPSPVTSARIEGAVAPTFANLVQLQVSRLGMPPMAASDFGVRASCRKQAGGTSGAGDWRCTLTWYGPQRQTLNHTYDLFVSTDGCYTATVSEDQLGGPTLQAGDGSDIRNLLYAFEGCFDTT